MPSFPITNLISLPSAIQIDKATFVDSITTGTVTCARILVGSVTVFGSTGQATFGSVVIQSNLTVTGLASVDSLIVASVASVNRLVSASNVQAVTGSFSGNLVVAGSQSVAGVAQFSAASFSANVTVTAGSFRVATPAVVTIGVGTAALSSDLSAQADLPSNSVRMVAVGTVLQFYFNQTGSVILRGVVNLATF